MSRIFTHWECDNCKAEFDNWVSFGHPDEDFDYKWKCPECDYTNVLHVEAWPDIPSTVTPIGDIAFNTPTGIRLKRRPLKVLVKSLKKQTRSFVSRRNK